MLFDCIFRAIFTKKTAKIAQEVWNLFQNVQKSFRKVRGRYEKRLDFRRRENDEKCKKLPNGPPLGRNKQICLRKLMVFDQKQKVSRPRIHTLD